MYIKSTSVFHNKAPMAKYKIRPLPLTKYFTTGVSKLVELRQTWRSKEWKRVLHKSSILIFKKQEILMWKYWVFWSWGLCKSTILIYRNCFMLHLYFLIASKLFNMSQWNRWHVYRCAWFEEMDDALIYE